MASRRFPSSLLALASVAAILARTALLDFSALTEHERK